MQIFERIEAWKRNHHLAVRAAYSAAANIAEGAAKKGTAEYRRYLDIAWASLTELSYGLILARELGYLNESNYSEIDVLRIDAAKVTWGLLAAISRREASVRQAGTTRQRVHPSTRP